MMSMNPTMSQWLWPSNETEWGKSFSTIGDVLNLWDLEDSRREFEKRFCLRVHFMDYV